MAVVEVWKCDNCGKILEDSMSVYQLKLESVGKKFEYDGYEKSEIELHFCEKCAKNIANSLKTIAERLEVQTNARP